MKFLIKNILKFTAVVAIIASTACSDDFMVSDETDNTGAIGGLSFRCADMLEVYSALDNDATRAEDDSKTKEEKLIKTLHVFFFDDDEEGELLTPNYDNFPSYQKINIEGESDMAFLSLNSSQWDGTNEAGYKGLFRDNDGNEANSRIKVVAIANIDALDNVTPESDDNRFLTQLTDGTILSNGKIQKAGRTYVEDFVIQKYSDLEKWVYYPKIRMSEDGTSGDISELPKSGMPMIGEQYIDLSQKNSVVVNMKALMAKVNVSVKLEPDEYTDEFPILIIDEYGILNMPIAVPFKQPEGKPVGGNWTKPETLDDYFKSYDVTNQPMFHKDGTPSGWDMNHQHCSQDSHEFITEEKNPIRLKRGDGSVQRFSYYTFENINMPNYAAKRASVDGVEYDAFNGSGGSTGYEPNYPDGVTDQVDYQRWKPTIAYKDRASAMILKGHYTNHQGIEYQAQFTIYLGADTDTDFQVKRNHRYDNNIVIKGLDYVRNSVDDVYTFDGRVNVKSDNQLYLAIVNERKVDVHATALPMDVWLLNYEEKEQPDYYTDVTVSIPKEAQDWVQMVMIPRAEMQSDNGRFYPGTGMEKYFYTNLLNDIKNNPKRILNSYSYSTGNGRNKVTVKPYDGHDEGAQCGSEVTVSCTPSVNNSRSRIYFYIDENSSDWQYVMKNGSKYYTGTADRSVKVQVKYKSYRKGEDGSEILIEPEKTQTIEIEQRGLRRVDGPWKSWHTESPYYDPNGEAIEETYIEYYEEYLNHTDPLDEHIAGDVYEGLEWGLSGKTIPSEIPGINGNPVNTCLAKDASVLTRWIIDNTKNNNVDRMKDVLLYPKNKEDKPYSAFHYIYGKNKRDYDGTVPSNGSSSTGYYGWYMPGIKELETALVQYYETFSDFQNKFYWSCAPNTSVYYARSTKVLITSDRVEYVDSDQNKPGNPQYAGYKARTDELRIRAFYRRNPDTQK